MRYDLNICRYQKMLQGDCWANLTYQVCCLLDLSLSPF